MWYYSRKICAVIFFDRYIALCQSIVTEGGLLFICSQVILTRGLKSALKCVIMKR